MGEMTHPRPPTLYDGGYSFFISDIALARQMLPRESSGMSENLEANRNEPEANAVIELSTSCDL